MNQSALHHKIKNALTQVNHIVFGKPEAVQLAFVCILSEGHLLIEDLPGMGKTTLAHALAATLGLQFHRLQMTSDLLPSDILGVSIYDSSRQAFTFHPGVIFSEMVLVDELNRAMPKTQSALLEAMAEHQITVDGQTHRLPQPFFVIATQNPIDAAGTFVLPDSQLDRFLMCIHLGYPDTQAERQLLQRTKTHNLLQSVPAIFTGEEIRAIQQQIECILTSAALIDYAHQLIQKTRQHTKVRVGLSPRGGLALLRAAKAMAFLQQRDFVQPEDIQAVFQAVVAHRLVTVDAHNPIDICADIIKSTALDTHE